MIDTRSPLAFVSAVVLVVQIYAIVTWPGLPEVLPALTLVIGGAGSVAGSLWMMKRLVRGAVRATLPETTGEPRPPSRAAPAAVPEAAPPAG